MLEYFFKGKKNKFIEILISKYHIFLYLIQYININDFIIIQTQPNNLKNSQNREFIYYFYKKNKLKIFLFNNFNFIK